MNETIMHFNILKIFNISTLYPRDLGVPDQTKSKLPISISEKAHTN